MNVRNPVSDDDIEAVRGFNRFHTGIIGVLDEHLLATSYSLPQGRILYEIANAAPDAAPSARDLGTTLRMDTGYLSRVISGLVAEGLVARTPSPGNAKRLELTLTDKGQAVFAELNGASAREVASFLGPLSASDRRQLCGAMQCIRRLLGDTPKDRTFVLREPEPGDMGWIVHKHGTIYAREYGLDGRFEALVAEIVAQFTKSFIPGQERCWVAELEGQVVGSVFLVRQDDETAKLRLLYVDPAARGLGLGRRLVQECVRFARTSGYRRIDLWTNDVLVSAIRIYRAAGFRLIQEEPHHSFGKDLVGQTWRLEL